MRTDTSSTLLHAIFKGEIGASGVASVVAVTGSTVVIGAANGHLRHYELEPYLSDKPFTHGVNLRETM